MGSNTASPALVIVIFVVISCKITIGLVIAACRRQQAEAQQGQNVVYYGNRGEQDGLGSGSRRRDVESGLVAVAEIGLGGIEAATSVNDCGGGGGCLCGGGGHGGGVGCCGGGGCGGGDGGGG
ncbi:hypothetical protein KFK09_006923 [Dendrobium nobile]|uniref:Uncharacterized protein n=1 Tax=Dendrobium nobile TaxID=94219 RepID=A0A8T3BQG6_DENNO|nr:hypothetical protein KFK09_006923 [Dendrobium nobile]